MPRVEYTKPPGPLPTIEQVRRSRFRFRGDQWRQLAKLLPSKLTTAPVESAYIDEAAKSPHVPTRMLKTIADAVVYETEGAVNSHLSLPDGRMPTVANVLAAIRRLRTALKLMQSVDTDTANLIPEGLDEKLLAREQELARMRLPPYPSRALAMLCQTISAIVQEFATAECETVSKQDIVRYVDVALTCAGIKHPDIAKHRDRLAALVFPKH